MANEGTISGGGSGSMTAAQMLLRLTGVATLAAGALLYGDGDATLDTLAPGTNGHILTLAAGLPTWAANPASALPGSYAVGDLLYASNSTTFAKLAAVASGSVLASAGVTTAPAWSSSIALLGTIASKQSAAAGISLDHNSAMGNFTHRLSPTNLTANRRTTLGDADFAFTGGGTLALGGFTLTVAASGTAALLVANTFTATQTIAQGTISDPSLNLYGTVTWNDAADTFTAWKLNVTDTASAAASLLLDLQVGGASKLTVTKAGDIQVTSGVINGTSTSQGYVTLGTDGLKINNAEGTGGSNLRLGSAYSRPGLYRNGTITVLTQGNGFFINSGVDGAGGEVYIGTETDNGAYKVQVAGNLYLAHGTLTSAVPTLDTLVTWNSAGVTFTGWKLNVTNTASAAASLLIDLQVGGTSTIQGFVDGRLYQWLLSSAAGAIKQGNIQSVRTTGGTPSAGFGLKNQINLQSSTTQDQNALDIEASWADATHASRKARTTFSVYDTSAREALRIEASGSAPMIGFLGASAVARATMAAATGSATRTTFDTTTVTTAQLAERVKALIDDFRSYGLHG